MTIDTPDFQAARDDDATVRPQGPLSSSLPLCIRGGRVYDPTQDSTPNGYVRDIFVSGDRIVEALNPDDSAEVIDAAGMIVMAGGLDMHAHIAGSAIGVAREIATAMGQATLVPSPRETGQRYVQLGYTTVIEAAAAPADVTCVDVQLDDTPWLDTGFLLLLDNHDHLIDLLDKGDAAGAAAWVGEMLQRTGAYGLKVVNPGGVATWRRTAGQEVLRTLDDCIPDTRVTPRMILELLGNVVADLHLPHPLHVHAPGLGQPGNVDLLLDTLRAMSGRPVHVAHLQFHAYGRNDRGGFRGAAHEVCAYLAEHPEVTADVGMVMFGPAMTVTADLPLEHRLMRQEGAAADLARFIDCGDGVGFGIMPMTWSPTNPVHSLQWALGLELLLRCPNPGQIVLSIDHPNGGSFERYPEIIALLMSHARRADALRHVHPRALEQTGLAEIAREMTLGEIAALTRSGPAKALGLADQGSLRPGAEANVVVLADCTANPQAMFDAPVHVIKGGKRLVRHGELTTQPPAPGRRLRALPR